MLRHSLVEARRLSGGVALLLMSTASFADHLSARAIVETTEITSVSVSPNGESMVVGLAQPDVDENKRKVSWVVLPTSGTSPPRRFVGGDEIYDPDGPGALMRRAAQWAIDSQSFFYLRRDGDEVQLWSSSGDGASQKKLTTSPADIIDLQPSNEPNLLLLKLMPDRRLLREAEREEDRNGILYDDRIIGGMPLTHTLPVVTSWTSLRRDPASGQWVPPGPTTRTSATYDMRRGIFRLLSEEDAPSRFSSSEVLLADGRRFSFTVADEETADSDSNGHVQTSTIQSTSSDGRSLRCLKSECFGHHIRPLAVSADGTSLYYLREQQPGLDAIYRWDLVENAVQLVLDSKGRVDVPSNLGPKVRVLPERAPFLVFAYSSVDEPPRIDRLDLSSGVVTTVFDPNKELRRLTSHRAIWRTWRTVSGYPGRAVLVLPRHVDPRTRYPLVITTYSCRGFLRGGGGDQAPEYLLADQGFIAACLDVPYDEIWRREPDRTKIYSLTIAIVQDLVTHLDHEGLIDPERVGITGQSLGANAIAYGLGRTTAFAAVALRHGSGIERENWDLFDTAPQIRSPSGGYASFGMPDPNADPTGLWDSISAARAAGQVRAPVLIQVNDTEYLRALKFWSALRENGRAVEMYVFPRETHLLIQPVHQLVNIERQIDWFRFWLKGVEDNDARKVEQFKRWHRMRDQATALGRSITSR